MTPENANLLASPQVPRTRKERYIFSGRVTAAGDLGVVFRTHHTQFIVMLNVNNDLQGPKQWLVPRRGESKVASGGTIEPGDAGIWATCGMGKEGKCAAELKDIFNEVPRKG